jgi:hypothetical protein
MFQLRKLAFCTSCETPPLSARPLGVSFSWGLDIWSRVTERLTAARLDDEDGLRKKRRPKIYSHPFLVIQRRCAPFIFVANSRGSAPVRQRNYMFLPRWRCCDRGHIRR